MRLLCLVLLLGCAEHHRVDPTDAEAPFECEELEPVSFTNALLARLAVRGDSPLVAWTHDDGSATIGGPGRSDEVLMTGARGIDIAPTRDGFVVAIAGEASTRVVEVVGEERRATELPVVTGLVSVGAVGDVRLVAVDTDDDSSSLAIGRDEWELVPLGRVRAATIASDGELAAVAATGFDGLAVVVHEGRRLGEITTYPGGTRTSFDVDVADGVAWVVGAYLGPAGRLRVEAYGWDGRWTEAELVGTVEGYGDVTIAAAPEPRVFVTAGRVHEFVRRRGAWVEESVVDSSVNPAFPSAAGDATRWGVVWQDVDRQDVELWTHDTAPRVLADRSNHLLPQLVLGERCFHAIWSEWTGERYRAWYWRGR